MFSLILPTLGTRIPELKRLLSSLLKQEGVEIELIIVAQDNFNEIQEVINDFKEKINIKLFEVNEKGLSKARNIGLTHIQGDIVVFTDDDCWYPPNILNQIRGKVKESQICTFQIYDPEKNKLFKRYSPKKNRHHSIFKSFKVSSIEIFINTDKINCGNLVFDEDFGLGAKYSSGEENNLLLDLIEKKYRVDYYPEVVVYHHINERVFNQEELFVKGVFFRRNFNLAMSVFLGVGFYLKKFSLVDEKVIGFMKILQGAFSYEKKKF